MKYLPTILLLITTLVSWAQIPQTLSFQGFLTDSGGTPVDGNQSITFSIYRKADDAQVWTETQATVAVSNGLYNVELGSDTPFSFAFDQPYELEVSLGGTALTPRINLTSSAFSLGAYSMIGDSNVVPPDGNVGFGTLNPSQKLDVRSSGADADASVLVGNSDLSHQLLLFSGRTSDPSPFIGWADGDPLRFAEFEGGGFAERLRIEQGTGYLGVGTTDPNAEVDVVGNETGGVGFRTQNTNADGWSFMGFRNDLNNAFSLSVGGSTATRAPNSFYIFNGTTSNASVVVDQSDNVGIGTESPATRLDVQNDNSLTTMRVNHSFGAGNGLIEFYNGGTFLGNITFSGTTITYGLFTGSHIGSIKEHVEVGELVSHTGSFANNVDAIPSEPFYDLIKSNLENDPKIIGSYLHDVNKPELGNNLVLVMAVGNGQMWVVDDGADLEVGDYLISSKTSGHAVKDVGKYEVAYIVARVAENVKWDEVEDISNDGKKHKLVHVTFENFIRNHKAEKLEERIESLEREIIELRSLFLDSN